MPPKVSVMMTTYNHERFIGQAVTSALEQEVDFPYEIVIGEDCSTDRTRDILLGFQARYPDRLRLLLREENWGGRRNFIDTFWACQGEYVAILEGDDYWISPYKLQRQVRLLDSQPEYTVCFHPVVRRYEGSGGEMELFAPNPRRAAYSIEDLLVRTLIVTCSVMFRNRLFDEFPDWFYNVPAADWPLSILNAQYGDIGYIDEAMAVYRIHSGGVWSSRSAVRRQQGRIEILRALRQYLGPQYQPIVDRSIARSHLKIVRALARERDWKGVRLELSQVFFLERIPPIVLVRAAMGLIGHRVGQR